LPQARSTRPTYRRSGAAPPYARRLPLWKWLAMSALAFHSSAERLRLHPGALVEESRGDRAYQQTGPLESSEPVSSMNPKRAALSPESYSSKPRNSGDSNERRAESKRGAKPMPLTGSTLTKSLQKRRPSRWKGRKAGVGARSSDASFGCWSDMCRYSDQQFVAGQLSPWVAGDRP
jgi:hypothetical protein